ncbi:MAG UNVERIFIED_CONTAM: hypothetical protein LVT10_03250 [Anaerolineae bacterium]
MDQIRKSAAGELPADDPNYDLVNRLVVSHSAIWNFLFTYSGWGTHGSSRTARRRSHS